MARGRESRGARAQRLGDARGRPAPGRLDDHDASSRAACTASTAAASRESCGRWGAALWLEARYGKREILEAYLNFAPYGGNIEGVGAASLVYFQKRAADLTLTEALTLAVIPQNPRARGEGARGARVANAASGLAPSRAAPRVRVARSASRRRRAQPRRRPSRAHRRVPAVPRAPSRGPVARAVAAARR
jgi:hypothetical protein